MLKPNYVDGKTLLFSSPNELILTAANSVAIDHVLSSTDIYPQAYTATIQETFDERVVRGVVANLDIIAAKRIAFGLFLKDSASLDPAKQNLIFRCRGSLTMWCEASTINVYPVFGRLSTATVNSSLVIAANKLSSYIVLPTVSGNNHVWSASAGNIVKIDVDCQVNKLGYDTNGYPLCFAFVIENTHSTNDHYIQYLNSSMEFQAWNDTMQAYRPAGA